MWLRDILEDLCHQKIRDVTDFEWQKYIRPYFLPSEDQPLKEEAEEEDEDSFIVDGGESHVASSHRSSVSIVLRCLDQQLSYGFEYQGCVTVPVMTTRMDNYLIAFTQVQSFVLILIYSPVQTNVHVYLYITCMFYCNDFSSLQGLQSHLGSMLIGPSGSGKVHLIKVRKWICMKCFSVLTCFVHLLPPHGLGYWPVMWTVCSPHPLLLPH